MSKVIGGIFCLVGTLGSIYFWFVLMNSSWFLDYNDPKLHTDMLGSGSLLPFLSFLFMATIGYTFMFVSEEPNLK